MHKTNAIKQGSYEDASDQSVMYPNSKVLNLEIDYVWLSMKCPKYTDL